METSPPMRAAQEVKLGPLAQKNGWTLKWHDSIDGLRPDTDKFTLVSAHEFFDALPFHLLQVRITLTGAVPIPAAIAAHSSSRCRKQTKDGKKYSSRPGLIPQPVRP